MKKIGPSFFAELKVAGLTGLPFTWSEAGVFCFGEDMTPAQVAEVQAVYSAHDPKAPAPAEAPKSVTMRQARLALLQVGLLTNVNNAVASMTGAQGEAASIEWEYSQEVRRDQQLVIELASVLKLSGAQLDALFVTAAEL